MSKISINTEKYIKNKIKEVEINGNNFTVRKPGAGEQLDSLENIRVLNNSKKRMAITDSESEQMEIIN
jgi:hypothetical protein